MKRRALLSLLGMSPALLTTASTRAGQTTSQAAENSQGSSPRAEGKITAVNPKGNPPPIQLIPMAPRLDSLHGKTVYLVDTGFHGSDVLLHQIEAWFSANMPDTKTTFKRKTGPYAEDDPVLWKEIKSQGNAVIMAVGH